MKGVAYATKPIKSEGIRNWMVHLDLDLGSNDQQELGSGGLALYYLRSFTPNQNSGLYGYTNKFDGVAVIISSMIKQRV